MKNYILFIILLLGLPLYSQFDYLKSTKNKILNKEALVSKSNLNISLILDFGFVSQSGEPEEYLFPGFAISEPEGRLESDSFYLGHNELTLSGNVDDWLFGQSTIVYTEHEGETEIELEEFFIETIGLGYGAIIRVGRFLPTIGYLNEQHLHNDIFVQRPFVYQAFLNGEYIDDGIQANIVLATKTYIELGIGAFAGRDKYPANNENGIGLYNIYTRIGGDFNQSSSWRLGASYFSGKAINREVLEGHGSNGPEPVLSFTGDSDNVVIDFKYQWAPKGNKKDKFIDFRAEWFYRTETGIYSDDLEDSIRERDYNGTQMGFYTQVLYQWQNRWGLAYRFDQLFGDNDAIPIEESGALGEFLSVKHKPVAHTIQLEYQHSEFNRIRIGYTNTDLDNDNNSIFYINFTSILGAHSAHRF